MSDLQRLTAALSDRYRLERELGAGGMATVYLGEDLRHRRRVAVKVLRPDLSAIVGAERFLVEIRVTANLQHPHILPLFDSGDADGLLFYVMPYVQGESLRDRLNREKQLPIDEAVRIAREVASALDYAHRQNVVHRDIKPENILLQDGTALVTDFGIALAVSKAGGTRLTETGLSLSTPYYMSPEQATGDRALDARTDVYSLAAVLYEMLSGDPPHTGSTAQAVIAAVVTEVPRDVATRRPRLAPHVAEAVHRALEKLPADRFASAAEFARALEGPALTTGRLAAAAARRGARRRWMPVALVACLAIGFVAGRLLFPPHTVRETRTRLTFSGNASAPIVSRDGRWLAYIRGVCQSSGAECGGDVVVQELPRGVPSVLLSGARDLSMGGWSPSGASILVAMRASSGEGGLYVLQRQGGVVRKVAGGASSYAFADDTTVGFAVRGSGTIQLADVATGDVRDSIVIGDGRWVLYSIDFSPVTGFIYVGGIHGSTFLQCVTDPRGKILDSLNRAGAGGWDLDGRHAMVLEINAQSVGRLMRIAVSRSGHLGRAVEVFGGFRQDEFTGGSSTPTGFVLGDAGRTSDIWAFAVGGTARRLTHGSTWHMGPAISADGNTVAYVKQDAWGSNVYTVPAAGGTESPVTADSGTRQIVRWLADGRRLSDISVAGGATGRISQEVVEPETGRLRTLPLEPGLIIVAWRPDGSALAEQIDYRGLTIVDSAGKTLRRIPVPDSLVPLASTALSPDGREVALVVVRQRAYRVYELQLDDGSIGLLATVNTSEPVHVRVERWASDGFIYVSRVLGASPPELWRIPQKGGVLRRFAPLPASCNQLSLTLSRDARSGACIVYDDRPDLWLVERR